MPAPVEEINSARSESLRIKEDSMNGSNKETSVIVSRADATSKEEVVDARQNVELRKDLLLEAPESYIEMDDESGLFKNDSLIPEEELEHEYLHRPPPSYVTLTPCHVPTAIHQDGETPDLSGDDVNNLTLIPNMLNYNPSCWVPSHDESALCLPQSHQLGSPCNMPINSAELPQMEYCHPPFVVMDENPFKPSFPMVSNPLYHLDTNNRRIWVPESCSTRGSTSAERRSPNCIGFNSIHEADVFMAGDFENEELLQQHSVNIERFPNRCWRGANPSRAQYEKGSTLRQIFSCPKIDI